ncbi:MAG: cobalt-precorrin 5A hydrolase [Treponema sp.]|uniref:cobalt-precorrin 5A hydrolase n=1 Tax=Treponema sp. TaxID=166 RepID=UPI0025D3F8DD|nr:cobalt-precorrin 5A hydrolase [Treponema sp.]MBQ9283211.1 cobalt-precorrin 5A hydrolase [Treponema sp.]
MRMHIISFTEAGFSLARRIQNLFQAEESYKNLAESEKSESLKAEFSFSEITIDSASSKSGKKLTLSEWVKAHFRTGNVLVFVGAAGIAVRAVAPFIRDKSTDPAVIVIDEKGSFVIPLLSGHIGGANSLAKKIAGLLGSQAVLTTASDVNNLPAIDEFAARNNLLINDMEKAKDFAAKVLNGENPSFTISVYIKNDILSLIPKCVILGIGCKKGKSPEELEEFVRESLDERKIDYRSLDKIASIDLKKDEKALVSLAESLKLPFLTFSAQELNQIQQKVTPSAFVSEITGTDNVCERSVFAAGASEIIVHKSACNGMTLAIGIKKINIEIPEEFQKFFIKNSEEN